ncbi:MAG: NAD(P)/FAD-dependent oxidoreductase [Clostridiales bacterium]|jgi:protoporphyrinogen oxidase|nr:NAD(P)/FAD-dependent oxidoreductase [Clostridiales bacterium]
MNIAIIGAGPTGLAAALELAKMDQDHKITVFEKSPDEIGGLAGAIPLGKTFIDKYYHHIFTSDTGILDMINELGLGAEMLWLEPKNGMYLNSTLYPFTNPIDLILFPVVSLASRVRMGLAVLKAKKVTDYKTLESITAKQWLIEKTGADAYEKIWRPLLVSKFGSDADKVSGVWIWNKFKLRGSTRQNVNKELLGYLRGSFYRVFKAAEEFLIRSNHKMCFEEVLSLGSYEGSKASLETRMGEYVFDKILFTGSPQQFCKLAGLTPTSGEYDKSGAAGVAFAQRALATKYKANICMTLTVKHRVSDYYWISIAESNAPFVLFIEHTNLVSDEAYEGKHIIYLSRYIDAEDDLFQQTDEEIKALFIEYMERMFAGFRRESIIDSYVYRSLYAQPVIGLNYSDHVLPMETPVKNIYLAGMAQVYPEDRGQAYAVTLGKKAAKLLNI